MDLGDALPADHKFVALGAAAVGVFVGGVLLRPFEMALVQFLEGYWPAGSLRGRVFPIAVERHRRRRDQATTLVDGTEAVAPPDNPSLTQLANFHRAMARERRIKERAGRTAAKYSTDDDLLSMPTALGKHPQECGRTDRAPLRARCAERLPAYLSFRGSRLPPGHRGKPLDRILRHLVAVHGIRDGVSGRIAADLPYELVDAYSPHRFGGVCDGIPRRSTSGTRPRRTDEGRVRRAPLRPGGSSALRPTDKRCCGAGTEPTDHCLPDRPYASPTTKNSRTSL